MNIKVNSKDQELKEKTNISELLTINNVDKPEMVSVQFNGKYGALLTFDLSSKDECFSFMNKLKIARRATNLNDNKTLILHPSSTIYTEYTDDLKAKMGIRDTMIRAAIGIEDIEDLIEDFNEALEAIK